MTNETERDRVEMSQRERDVLKVMHGVLEGKRTQSEAARLLKLSVRQVRRLQVKLRGSMEMLPWCTGYVASRRIVNTMRRIGDRC